MRILHVTNDFLPFSRAGTEHYLAELVVEQARAGLQPIILHLSPGDTAKATDDGMPYRLRRAPFTEALTFSVDIPSAHRIRLDNPMVEQSLKPWVALINPDVVHIHSMIGFSTRILNALGEQTPVVMTLHDFWLMCANAILIQSDGTTCSGPESILKCTACQKKHPVFADKNQLSRRFALHKKAMRRVDIAVSPSLFSQRLYKAFAFLPKRLVLAPLGMRPILSEIREEIDNQAIRFAYLGGLCWFKGPDLVVNAFQALHHTDARLDIYGMIANQAYFSHLKQLAGDNYLISFHGAYGKSDLGKIFSMSDIIVLPSRIESYSFVAREALSAGVPVIAADCGALPEVIRDQKNGLLFKSGDPVDLALKMSQILNDRETIARLKAEIAPTKTIQEDAEQTVEWYNALRKSR